MYRTIACVRGHSKNITAHFLVWTYKLSLSDKIILKIRVIDQTSFEKKGTKNVCMYFGKMKMFLFFLHMHCCQVYSFFKQSIGSSFTGFLNFWSFEKRLVHNFYSPRVWKLVVSWLKNVEKNQKNFNFYLYDMK